VPRLWERHLLNCAGIASLVPRGAQVGDVGSGAGLPGIVLAVLRPDLDVTLIEPLQRRTTFLERVVERLELDRVKVLRGRAEGREALAAAPFDVVTARAVAPLDRLARWCLPLVAPGGLLLAMKGAQAADELARARPMLRQVGGEDARVLTVAPGPSLELTIVVSMRRAARGGSPARPDRGGR
jgi:16S rRNA (guanine527-N7)-methyltransferase